MTNHSLTNKTKVQNQELYVTVVFDETSAAKPIGLFCKVAKQGSTLSGLMDCLTKAISVSLENGIEWQTIAKELVHHKFEPSDENYCSIVDALISSVSDMIEYKKDLWDVS